MKGRRQMPSKGTPAYLPTLRGLVLRLRNELVRLRPLLTRVAAGDTDMDEVRQRFRVSLDELGIHLKLLQELRAPAE